MQKSKAIALLGGSTAKAAKKLDLTYQAVAKWPEELPDYVVDRLIAYFVRQGRRVPPDVMASARAKAA